MKLKKSLYGLAIAPRLWYQHSSAALIKEGFKQSQFDPCLWIKKDIMLVQYVDDLGIGAKNKALVDELEAKLKSAGFELTREGSFSEFLGIKVARDDKAGTITLTQQGLIQKIMEATNLVDCKPNSMPAALKGLGSDPNGKPIREAWSYASIVGMLLYLSTNTRPDITFAVSQVARYNHSPKQSHATAVKMIIRYLAATKDQGIIMTPNGRLNIDSYVDADFAGLYGAEVDTDSSSVKSRTGYVIMLGNCPLLWKSQLQTKIALSTMEAEYTALSANLKVLLLLCQLLIEVSKIVNTKSLRALNTMLLSIIGSRITLSKVMPKL